VLLLLLLSPLSRYYVKHLPFQARFNPPTFFSAKTVCRPHVGWQLTLRDSIWQVTLRISEMGFPWWAIPFRVPMRLSQWSK